MIRRIGLLCVFALAAGTQTRSDKPSPVPRRPVRPRYVSKTPEKSGGQKSGKSAGESERSRTAVAGTKESGIACFFSSTANGASTASGVRLDSEELVAAHPWFPLGVWVRVKNPANGQSVDVRIVDRFPESSQRVVNLSEAAARKLGFIRAGTALVELEVIGANPAGDGK